jgi:hypothetical protein
MNNDKYTKAMLTVMAVCLVLICLKVMSMKQGARGSEIAGAVSDSVMGAFAAAASEARSHAQAETRRTMAEQVRRIEAFNMGFQRERCSLWSRAG